MSEALEDQPASRPWPWLAGGLAALGLVLVGIALERLFGWVEPTFVFIAHQFYEVPQVAALRQPSQLALTRIQLVLFGVLCSLVLLAGTRLNKHARGCLIWFLVAYAIRATIWVVGSNLPLVPGDSCHYIEVAASVWRGEGPVKHYVESFFTDYPPIRQGKGVLDDWATPLYAYLLAGVYRLTGVSPTGELETVLAVAKGTSFVVNLLCLPALYLFTRRMFGARPALLALAIMSVLPVHALYAAFELRESLVTLTSILGIWFLVELGEARTARARWGWMLAAGLAGGLAILARNTAMAVMAAGVLYLLLVQRFRAVVPLIGWGLLVGLVVAPWAWATYQAYGEPFYTYTKFFQYTFSWTVHHYQEGRPSAATFYTWANAPEILRVKLKALFIIIVTSTMIVGLPLVLAWLSRLASNRRNRFDLLGFLLVGAFVGGTLANVADITQVGQLGRYYLPLFCLILPMIAAGLCDWADNVALGRRVAPVLGLAIVCLLWSDPTWAYDYTWLTKPYQLHWTALREAGDWIRAHPQEVPEDARILTWFPWEMRLAGQRTTVLMPRSFQGARIEQVIRQYGVTHVLWGSFEPPPHVDPEMFGPYLQGVRTSLGLNERNEIFHSASRGLYPVRLYRLKGANP